MSAADAASPGRRALLAVGAAYLLVSLLGLAGVMIGPLVPCTGKLCEIGRAVEGGLVGAGLALILLAVVAHRLRMRWWFVPAILLLLSGGLLAMTRTDGPLAWALGLMVVASPVIAALLSSGLSRRVVAVAFGVLAVLLVIAVALLALWERLDDRRQDERRAERFRSTSMPLYAPLELQDAELRLTSGDDARVIYDLRTPEHEGWLRVVLYPAGGEECAWQNVRELGDGITAPGSVGDVVYRVCRDLGSVKAELWPDGGGSDWTGDEMLQVARQLAPADAEWFIERAS